MYTTGSSTDHTLDAGLQPVPIFDLALTKVINTTATPGPYLPGDNVSFTIEVFNQGNVDATDVVVTDYVPAEMIFNAGDNSDFSGATPTATIASVPAGTSVTLGITLQIASGTSAASTVNYAEITSFDDDNNTGTPPPTDEDSSPGDNAGTDETGSDNDIDDEYPGTPGTADNPADADDYDPAEVIISQPTCNLAITNVIVDCQNGSEFSVNFDVEWDYADAPANAIELIFAGQAPVTINPSSTVGTMSFGPFTYTAPEFGLSIQANFVGNTTCAAAAVFDLIACTEPCDPNELGGTAWNDSDNDGVQDAGESGQGNVLVEIYECDSTTPDYTVWTNANGEWSIPDAITYPVRVEFSAPNNPELLAGFAGTDNGTNVQFVAAPTCGINFGLVDPGAYCQANPKIVTSCFVEGDQVSAVGPVIISFDYNATPQAVETNDITLIASEATSAQVGSTFGLAYQRSSGKLFASAYMKRFAGFAPGTSPASIFVLDNPADGSASASEFVDLESIFAAGIAGTDPHDFTVTDIDPSPTYTIMEVLDANSFDQVGRVAFGDLEINEAGDSLYVVNLSNRSLYALSLGNDPANPQAPTLAGQIRVTALADAGNPLPGLGSGLTSGVAANEIIPFALKYKNDVLYVGFVGNGQFGGDLVGFVYAQDIATGSWTKVLEFPLNYTRGCAFANSVKCAGPADWNAWTATLPDGPAAMPVPFLEVPGTLEIEEGYPQPMLTDIEFDLNGNMILGLRDRFGDQGGFEAPHPSGAWLKNAAGQNLYWNGGSTSTSAGPGFVPLRVTRQDAFGDILRATPAGAGWSVNIADFTDNSNSIGSAGNVANGCPDGETYFNGDCYHAFGFLHEETSMGGLGIHPLTNVLITPSMDPRDNAFSNGIDWFDLNNIAGDRIKAITVLTGGNSAFGKAYGLGEIEFICEELPIQLGNYVWNDEDRDGVQDACESPISGLTVKLYSKPSDNADPELLATSITNAAGNYYFAGDGIDAAVWETTGAAVEKDSVYYIVFCGDSFDPASNKITLGATSFALTTANSGEGNLPDLNDSDAEIFTLGTLGNFPAICATATATDHTLDVGLAEGKMSLGNFVWEDINNNSMYDPTDPDFPEAGLPNVAMSLFEDADMNGVPDGAAIQQTTTDADGFYIFTGLDAGKYLVGVDSANFSPGGALEIYYVSSYITEADADLDVDQKDNGANVTYTPVIYADVLSTTIELVENNEPDTETFFGPQGDGGATPENSNLTVDFGFFLDCDGDGVSDQIENAEPDGDRDDDGLPNECDYDPAGYIYCELSGEVVTGGTISVVSTPLGGMIEIIKDGSDGHYQFFTNGIAGVYEFTYNPPAGYTINANCGSSDGSGSGNGGAFDPSEGSGDNPGGSNPVVLGQGDMDGGQVELPDYGCNNNPFYFTFDLAANDPFVFNNNIPLSCPCDLDITSVDIDCNNGSEFAVSVNLEWVDSDLENLSDDVNVTINGQTLSATASGSTGNLVVGPFTFSEPAFNMAVSAAFAGDPNCFDQQLIDLIACTTACTDLPNTEGVIGGTVWTDDSQDGILDVVESGQGNIKVEVFDCDDNLVCSTWTGADGSWNCESLTPGEEYRVEFANPLTPWLVPSFSGTDNGTNVQFVTAGDCTVDYGLFDPATACSDNPLVVVPCYDLGLAAGNTGPALVQIDHNFTGVHTPLATFEQIGATWGTAYQQFSGIIFNSTFLKRNVGMAQGPGHIFMTSATGSGFIGSFNLQGVNGIDLGSINRVADVNNTLDNDYELLSGDVGIDLDAFGKVGKVSFGDIDLYEDDKLFAINLNSSSLIVIDVSDPSALPNDGSLLPAGLVQEFPLDLGSACNGLGQMRPWALKIHNGIGYIGAVCDASISKNRADLEAVVFTFDPQDPGAGLTQVLNFALNYPREKSGFFGGSQNISANWQPWVDTWDELQKVNTGVKYIFPHHSPILTDIEFADDGAMLIGLGDRLGDQIGNLEPAPVSLSNNPPALLAEAWNAGDLLKACYINGVFVLEGSGGCSVNDGNANTNLLSDHDGPFANGEFFYDDYFAIDPPNNGAGHAEVNLGGLAVLAGSGEVLTPRYDPFNLFSQGLVRYSTVSGSTIGLYEVVPPGGALGKANGLGDPELLCEPAPLQIGNYVWVDLDQDGVQDACEDPLPGMMVKLYSKPSGGGDPVLLATTTTDASGNYYFAGDGLDDATWSATGQKVEKGKAYYLVFCGDGYDEAAGKLTVGSLPYTLTVADSGEGSQPDLNDSDVAEMDIPLLGALPAICITADTTDHTQDLGLVPPYDYGDLPDPIYATSDANNGPKHLLSSDNEVILGTVVDDDGDGQPSATAGEGAADGDDGDGSDDEDGVVLPAMIFEGETAVFQVTAVNNSEREAKLIAFVDWNGNGDFSDPGEMEFTTVEAESGTVVVSLTFAVPLDGAVNTLLGARFRISTDPDFIMDMPAGGSALDGEVEDYLVLVKEVDYGDLPEEYATTQAEDGPRHGVPANPVLFLGTAPDTENNGTPDPNADGDGADEDGVVFPAMIFAGETASIEIEVTNNGAAVAKLIGFIDWNGDGDFDDAEEMQFATIEGLTVGATETLIFNVPGNASTYQSLGARFRISTDPDFISGMPSGGLAMDGEVEDYLIEVKEVDYGDLPATYAVTNTEDGPRHGQPETPEVYLGGAPDGDDDGQEDPDAGEVDGGDGADEDGVTEPAMLFRGEDATFTVDVVTNTQAKVAGWVDFNGNGQFEAGEMQSEIVSTSGPVTFTFPVPLNAVINTDLGARFRISSDQDFIDNMPSTGFAMDGEVEDYIVRIKGLDFGDLPENYLVTDAEDGPRHGQPENPEVYLGSAPDVDDDGQEDPDAGEVDGGDGADEDGVTEPAMLFRGEDATFTVDVVTNTQAKVAGWVDFNDNGQFEAGEMQSQIVSTSGPVELTFPVPLDAVINTDLGARFRISSDQDFIDNMPSTGFAMDGEVEDYIVRIKGLDFGDLPEEYLVTDAEDGPRHGQPETPEVYLGSAPDVDDDGQEDPDAGEVDGGDGADEDGVTEPVMLFRGEDAVFTLDVVTNTEVKVAGWVDFNGNGQFEAGEMQSQIVSTSGPVELTFPVPLDAVINTDLGARFRISSDQDFIDNMPSTGFAMDGEVEDYIVRIKGLDFGDLPENYLVTDVEDGPRHGQPENPEVYLGGAPDGDDDGQEDPDAGEVDGGDGADEDGVTEPAMLFRGEDATFTVDVVTNTQAKVAGWVDFNGNGQFEAGEMQSEIVSTSGPVELTFPVPLDAVINTDLGARFRISSDQDFIDNMPSTGFAMDGEVEDYIVRIKGLDFGDLPENYLVTDAEDGPRHGQPETPEVYLGGAPDGDDDGQEDPDAGEVDGGDGADEDGVTEPAMLFRGEDAVFTLDVVTNTEVKVAGWVDFNGNGQFEASEMQSEIVSTSGPVTFTFPVPLNAVINTDLGARFRISSDQDFIDNMPSTGFAMDGEVEDYIVRIKGLDFGDLPENYLVTDAEDGPRHGQPENPEVYLGSAPDVDDDGQEDPDAGEVDGGDGADEDGVTEPAMLFRGEDAVFTLYVVTNTEVKVAGWVDFNGNGQFEAGEMQSQIVSTSGPVTFTFPVPLDAVINTDLGARFRISSDQDFKDNMPSTGFAMDGEVEDYIVRIKGLDFGDLPNTYPITAYDEDGARHGIPETNTLFLGEVVDVDDNGQVDVSAGEQSGGDDSDGQDDEDGVVEPAMLFQGEEAVFTVTVTNNTGQTAKVVGFADWNNNQSYDTAPELGEIAVGEAGPGVSQVELTFPVPQDAAYFTDLGVRFRVSTDPELMAQMSPSGFLMDGEVEDYIVRVKPLDYGDQQDEYDNEYEEDGPRHGVSEDPMVYIGGGVDFEPDAQPGEAADEDSDGGVTLPAMFFQGEEAVFEVSVTNNSGAVAKLIGFIDWNNDGDFDDDEEMQYVEVSSSVDPTIQTLTFQVPLGAVYYEDLGARFRLSTDPDFITEMPAGGFAMDGEVEDYLVRVKPLDFGDLPDVFIVEYEEDGPRHGLPEDPLVYIGDGVDEDPDGQPSPSAGEEGDGDDGDGNDDENGITKPEEIFRGQPAIFLVDVVNNSDQSAKLVGFVDWNRDGDFEDDEEMSAVIIDPNTVGQVEVMFNVPQDAEFYLPLTGVRFRITTDPIFFTEDGMTANGFVMDGEVEDCLLEVSPVEYGDLPASYGTLLADNGASHGEVQEGDLYLGELIDQDFDGQSDPMNMALGDDNDESDDDDGIEFLTPLIPGDTAKIRVDVTVLNDVDAFLNAWMDFDGNGQMDASDALEFFAVDGTPIAPTTNLAVEDGSYVLCFLVPQTATFAPGGMAYSRFRLSSEGDLAPTGFTMTGEVEDYKVQLAKVGNLVWRDYNYNGIQDENEPGIETPTEVTLVFAGEDGEFGTDDDFESRTTTDENGLYYFCGLIEDDESMYKLIFTSDFFPTLTNVSSTTDDLDSDGEVTSDTTVAVMFLLDEIGAQPLEEAGINDDPNDQGNFPDAVTDQTFDQGYAGFDYGDLPDEYLTSDDSYNDEGTRHIYFPGKYLGSCIDLDLDGQPTAYGDGDDNNEGVYTEGDCEEVGDDEDGITFLTPLIPGYTAKMEITYTNTAGEEPEDAYLNGWIDWNGDGVLDGSDKLTFTLVDEVAVNSENLPLTPGEAVTLVACFDVPADAIFRDGNAYVRFRLGCEPDMPSFGTILGGEVEDYVVPLAKVGNLAWYDNDLDGVQDGETGVPQEPGVGSVEFILTYAGYGDDVFGDDNDFEYTTITTADGLYNFCGLIEGKYLLEVQKYDDDEVDPDHETPEHYILTVPNLGDSDNLDSDFTPALMIMIPDLLEEGLITGENGHLDAPGEEGFPDERDDLSLDIGWIPEPNVEALVNIAGVDFAPNAGISGNCDEFNIIVDVCIKNTGYRVEEGVLVGTPLVNLSSQLNLQAAMGNMFVAMDGAPILLSELGYDNTSLMAMPAEDRLPGINVAYDGSGDTELLDGTGLLYPGENICVRLNITVNPKLVSMDAAMAVALQAKVSGLAVNYQGVPIPDYFNGGAQYMAMDLSDNDWNFTGGYHDPDDAESFGNCFKEVVPVTVYDQLNISANAECGVCIDASEVVAGYAAECGEENYPLGGFYRLTVDGVATDAEEICLSGEDIVDGKFTFSIRTVNEPCYPTWGEVLLEDKTLPTLECPDDIAEVDNQPLVCADVETLLLKGTHSYVVDKDGNIETITDELKAILDLTGYALAEDNCAGLTVYINDELIEEGPCDDQIIKRTFWIQAEVQGVLETETCMQLITFTKPHLENVEEPLDVELPCTAELELDKYGNPHPNETGYPVVVTGMGTYELAQEFCNLGASYTDGERIVVCEGTYKLVRTWEILDWCAEGEARFTEFDQIIKIVDDKGPEVACVTVDYDNDGIEDLRTYSTGPYDCTAAFEVPLPEVSDACSGWTVLTEILTNGEVVAVIPVGASRYVSGMPVGCHEIRYIVVDDCGNKTVIHCPFQVLDQVAPIAVCDDDLNISLGGLNFARVTAEDIDEGSSDNCGEVYLEVRRRIDNIEDYACLDMFDYDGDGEVIGDEIIQSTEAGDASGTKSYYTPWEPYVDFNCCDMGEMVRIELRVWDDANGSGTFGDEIEIPVCYNYAVQTVKDNYNVCWLDVLIEDKVPPVCTPPLAAEIDCDKLPFDFDPQDEVQMTELFGAAEGFDNCGNFTVEELEADTTGLNDCGSGYFTRRFRVTDVKGIESAVCRQVITIHQIHDYWIKFPADAEANCGAPMVDTVLTSEGACDLLAINVKEEIFSASGDECYKIFRTYSVINWCEYDGISDPVVVSRDEDCDGAPGDEAVYVIVKTKQESDPCADYYGNEPADSYEHVWYDRDSDPFNSVPLAGTKQENCDYTTNPLGFWKEVVPVTENESPDKDGYPANGKDRCDEMASVGYWQYTQVIKVYDNVKPILLTSELEPFCTYSSDLDNGCPADVSISFQVDENCTPEDVTVSILLDKDSDGILDGDVSNQLSANYPDYTFSGSFPIGKHTLKITVSDGCGNTTGGEIPFEVADCKAPTPICINGLAIELMPVWAADADGDGDTDAGAMTIWASDFIASPSTDCSGEVTYSMNRTGEDSDPTQTGLTLTCDDTPTTLIEIWAWDAAGNGDVCQTYILVQDNMVNCVGGGTVAGVITTEQTEAVEGVTVELSGGQFQSMDTKADGHYTFEGLETGFDYTVTPHHDALPLNGVSTFDLVLMSKHILSIQPLDSPYKRIAADVNNDKKITALDAILLRRLILNIDEAFEFNTSWRFIPRDYVFPDPQDPWSKAFPEVININNLQEDLMEEDFIAVKIGDIDLNAQPNALLSEPRTVNGLFLLDVQDEELKAGNTYTVHFRADQLADIQGYQLTLSLDRKGIQLAGIDYGLATENNFGLNFMEEGLIAMSWNKRGDAAGDSYGAEDILFSLEIKAITDTKLSEVLGVSSRITPAEAYDEHDGLMDVGIDFNTGIIAKVPFELYQNVPNPFREETVIGFYLPEESEATVRIHDASGRVIKLIRGAFAQGQNRVILKRSELAETGMLYYTLTAGEHTATRKMVLVK